MQTQVNLVHHDWNIAKLVEGAAFNLYDGSLTVPPCDPNVKIVAYFTRGG